MTVHHLNDRYELGDSIGVGAHGRVFAARDQVSGDEVAIKFVGETDSGDASSAAGRAIASQFRAEFARVSSLHHPQLLAVRDIGTVHNDLKLEPPVAAGSLFFTAEKLDGESLADWGASARDPLDVLSRLEECADALSAVHRAGIVHCDIKPSNIIVSPERGAVILDFGLSLARGVRGQGRGTLAYMDARALSGEPDPQSDLHALGVSFFRALTGDAPFPASSPTALASALTLENPPHLGDVRPELSGPLTEVIDNLLRASECPRSASALLGRLWDAREALGHPARRRSLRDRGGSLVRLVGRDEVIERGVAAVRLSPGESATLISVAGEAGLGAGAVIDEVARRAQLAAIANGTSLEVLRGPLSEVIGSLTHRGQKRLAGLEGRARLVATADAAIAGLAARAESSPVLWVMHPSETSDETANEFVSALAAGHRGLEPVPATIIGRFELPANGREDRMTVLPLDPLTLGEIAELAQAILGEQPPTSWLRNFASHCLGRPRALVHGLMAAARRSEPIGELDPIELVSADEAASIDAELDRVAAGLDERQAELVTAASFEAGSSLSSLASLLAESESWLVEKSAELLASGWLSRTESGLRPRTSPHGRAAERALGAKTRKALHRIALDQFAETNTAAARARHLTVVGPAREALSAQREAARWHFGRGELSRAHALAADLAERSEGAELSRVSLLLAEINLELGDYDGARAAAERAARSRDPQRRSQALLLAARARQRGGDLSGAAGDLELLLEKAPGDQTALGSLAKIHLLRGDYEKAGILLGDANSLLARADEPGLEVCLEAAGLAWLYGGDRSAAEQAFEALRKLALLRDSEVLLGRASALLGLWAHHDGHVALAADHYRDAAKIAIRGGLIHAAASAEINRATAEADRGRFISALAALDSALVLLRRLGSVSELAAALYNRAHCLFALGDMSAASGTAKQALELARETGRTQFELYAHLLLGDVARRHGDTDAALAAYRAGAELAETASATLDTTSAELNLAELCAERGELTALEHLDRAEEAGSGDRARLLLSRARVVLALGVAAPGLIDEIEPAAESARGLGREDLYWRLSALAGRLAASAGDRDRARRHVAAAAAELARTLAAVPANRHTAMGRDPDVVALRSLEAELELSSLRVPAPTDRDESGDSLRRLLALSSRLNSELHLEPLLDQVIDTAIDLSGAERGFLLLEKDGGLEVAVARNIDQCALADSEDTRVSLSIAERAARSGEIVLAVDAAFDERWEASESVAAMRLRSVLAVPLRFRRDLIGTIYVDHRFQVGAFGERSVRLVRELANIAGVAIGNARVAEENRKRASEISALNRLLEDELGQRENELVLVKSQLEGGPPPAREIVGSSPAIRELHSVIERMAQSNLPVVVTGESGSGKELVARALHRLSPRRRGPFVAVNCGAVAETLLESELFGHVRGAFTGADRNRRGHFEVADGGTLFLDEIADTSPAMQAKLLRVLQEGELRRLGDEELRKVDVRVLAATNKDLRALATEGRFREDLFFRLNVLAVRVPPLRERTSDIAELADHLLARSGEKPATLARDALAALCSYSWPGNVRELENELARAAALADGRIGRSHLSPHIASSANGRSAATEDLDIKGRVESLERELIEAALEQSGGNQTRAAKILGLSRYGLQKKLKRYEI